MNTQRPPLPPFTLESAVEKVRLAEDGWNSRDPEKVALAYTVDSYWRNRSEFVQGREAIIAFLTRKWPRELDYRLIKELWAFRENRIAMRFAYEWHDDSGNWFRSYGNENWEFDDDGLMRRRLACINDAPIREADRRFHLVPGPPPRPSSRSQRSGLLIIRDPSSSFRPLLRLQPKTAFSRFAPVHRADLQGQQRVDCGQSEAR